jgi:hypothetical protein
MDETTTTTPAFNVTSRVFDHGQRGSKGRVFTDWKPEDVEPEPTGPLCADQACRNCNAHEAHGGKREVDHRVWKAWVRRVTAVWKAELVTILADFWGVDPDEVRVRFSSKAGCSCGCSPGWVIESGHGTRRNFFVKGHVQ